MKPNKITVKGNKTFNFYFFTVKDYENGLDYSVENEVLLFQNECIEMDGYTSDMTKNDELTLYSSMNCSTEAIERIKANDCIIITSFYN